ncbi:hypothetical protein Rhe02_51650 [Rhizocola hellebori]|uniref:Uncharacterized protein n=1 Tax=Rhizocola hellebori TaxID=1392758 RepID=A0A8J3QAB0_9ACTN|nr:hypothetical protein [Rhizocola hellebori]GIH07098.1 hypothetical protein Rhe02_51650 [Rhizocola hellebori]
MKRLAIVVVTVLAALVSTAMPASAVSSGNSKNNFFRECSATVVVSDTTTPGKVEGYGGWGCAATSGFCPGYLVVTISYNGQEVIRTQKNTGPLTCPTTWSASVTYPDWSTVDGYRASIIVKGPYTNFTLWTGTIYT